LLPAVHKASDPSAALPNVTAYPDHNNGPGTPSFQTQHVLIGLLFQGDAHGQDGQSDRVITFGGSRTASLAYAPFASTGGGSFLPATQDSARSAFFSGFGSPESQQALTFNGQHAVGGQFDGAISAINTWAGRAHLR
jgi:hypothetical protein